MDSVKRSGVARAIKSTSSKGKKVEAHSGDDSSRKAANSVTAGSRGVQRETGLPSSDRSCSPSSSLDGAPSDMHRRRRKRPGPADGYDSASASESSDAARPTAAAPAAGGQLPKPQQPRSTSYESSDAASARRLVQRGARLSKETNADFLGNFDPDCSSREMRKVHRRIAEDRLNNANKSQTLYDGQGCFLEDGSDICDCLEEGCPGCFSTCSKCGSSKCSTACRSNRRWMVESVEVEGVGIARQHPHLQTAEHKPSHNPATPRTADLSSHSTHFRMGTR